MLIGCSYNEIRRFAAVVKIVVLTLTLVVLTCAALHLPASADKITIDPNSPEGRALLAQTMKIDARVAQKVTYSATRKDVAGVLSDLSRLTGVTLVAGEDEKDWRVREHLMTLIVRDLPLADIMNSTARVLRFRWRKEGPEGKWVDRLYTDRRALTAAEIEKQDAEDLAAQQTVSGRQRLGQSLSELANMSDSKLAQLKNDNPYAYMLASSGAADGLARFFEQCPEAGQAFATGGSYGCKATRLSSAARTALLGVIPALRKLQMWGARVTDNPPSDYQPAPDDLSEKIDEIAFSICPSANASSGYLASISVSFPQPMFGDCAFVELRDPSSDAAKAEGRMMLDVSEKTMPWDDARQQFRQSCAAAIYKQQTDLNEQLSEASDLSRDDADLQRKAEIKYDSGKQYQIADFAEVIAKSFNLCVVADSYKHTWSGVTFGARSGQETLRQVLDETKQFCQCRCRKRGSVVELIDNNWFAKRKEQIPEAWLLHWQGVFKKTGTLDINELASIAALSKEQYFANVANDDTLTNRQGQDSEFHRKIGGNLEVRSLLAFYEVLTPRQQKMIFSVHGLDLLGIRPDKREAVENYLGAPTESNSPLNPANGVVQLSLIGERRPQGKQFDYSFVLKTDTGNGLKETKRVSFTTPVYIAPKREEPKTSENR